MDTDNIGQINIVKKRIASSHLLPSYPMLIISKNSSTQPNSNGKKVIQKCKIKVWIAFVEMLLNVSTDLQEPHNFPTATWQLNSSL